MGSTDRSFRSAGVITLTSDFGQEDPFVGIMKGVISRRSRDLSVIDLCHEVPPFRPEIGGLWLGLCYRWFPPGSVHVAVVDPGVGTARRILCLSGHDHLFLAPDNGLAAELASHLDHWSARRVDPEGLGLDVASTTFHGRDIFAPVAAALATGDMGPQDMGSTTEELTPSGLPRPAISGTQITGELLLADRFGNLYSNIPGPLPRHWTRAAASVGGHEVRLVRAYDEARSGEYVAIFNSFGLLEIALPRGSAEAAGRWPPGTPVSLFETR